MNGNAITFVRVIFLALCVLLSGCDLFGGDDNKREDVLLGSLLWERALADELVIDTTQPLIDGDKVYVVAGGQLLCLSHNEGTLEWVVDFSGHVRSRNIVHDDDVLFLTHDGAVEAYAKVDGSLLWRAIPGFHISGQHFIEQTDTHIYIGGAEGWMGRIRKTDGIFDQVIYLSDLKPDGDDHGVERMLAHENRLYVPTSHFVEGVPGIGGTLLVYERANADFLWGYEAEKRQVPIPLRPGEFYTTDVDMSEVVISEDMLVVAASTSIIGFDRHTGEKKWEQFFANDDAFRLGLAASNGVVYAGSLGAYVYAIDANSGEILWQSERMAASILSQIVLDNGSVYVNGGKLFVLDAKTGETLWSGHPPDYESTNRYATYLSPVSVGGGVMVIVGTHKIYGHVAF